MSEDAGGGWQSIDTAPKDQEILVYTRPWGTIVASYSGEHGEWLSRMQVPVSIKEEEELPTHWRPLPEPPEGIGEPGADARGVRRLPPEAVGGRCSRPHRGAGANRAKRPTANRACAADRSATANGKGTDRCASGSDCCAGPTPHGSSSPCDQA